MEQFKKVAGIVARVFSIISVICVLCYGLICAPIIFGSIPEVVLSGSMEKALSQGDLIYYTPVPKEEIAVGDIISFKRNNSMVSHRVSAVDEDGKYITKGDANEDEDNLKVEFSEIEGKVGSFKLPVVGYILMFINTHLWVVAILAAIFILDFVLHL